MSLAQDKEPLTLYLKAVNGAGLLRPNGLRAFLLDTETVK